MATPDTSPALKRKLAPPRSTWTVLNPVERICQEELPRAAEDLLGLEAEVVSVAMDFPTRGALVDLLGDTDLIFVLSLSEGPVGLVSGDAELLAALIEVQMLGRVLASARPPRTPTTTDGIIARAMLSDWVSVLEDHLPGSGAYRLGPRIPDARAARLTLDDGHFRTLTITLDLGGGNRQGRLVIACPELMVSTNSAGLTQQDAMRRHLEVVTVDLQAVLARLKLPIEEVQALKVDQFIALPDEAPERLTLETRVEEKIAFAKLGKLDRRRAVRILPPRHKVEGPVLIEPQPEPGDGSDDTLGLD